MQAKHVSRKCGIWLWHYVFQRESRLQQGPSRDAPFRLWARPYARFRANQEIA